MPETIEDVIAKLTASELVYVGKNYTIADLIADLRHVDEHYASETAAVILEASEFYA